MSGVDDPLRVAARDVLAAFHTIPASLAGRHVAVLDALESALEATPPPIGGLDVERLARAMHEVTVAEPGLLSDVDMLNDPYEGDPLPAARAIAAEYARSAAPPPPTDTAAPGMTAG